MTKGGQKKERENGHNKAVASSSWNSNSNKRPSQDGAAPSASARTGGALPLSEQQEKPKPRPSSPRSSSPPVHTNGLGKPPGERKGRREPIMRQDSLRTKLRKLAMEEDFPASDGLDSSTILSPKIKDCTMGDGSSGGSSPPPALKAGSKDHTSFSVRKRKLLKAAKDMKEMEATSPAATVPTSKGSPSVSPGRKVDRSASKSPSRFVEVASSVVASRKAAQKFKSSWVNPAASHPTDWSVVGGIHLKKKKLSLQQFFSEYRKMKRDDFYQELVVYIVVIYLMMSMFWWLPMHQSYEQSDVLKSFICKEGTEVCSFDTVNDIYGFLRHMEENICDDSDSDANLRRWYRVGTMQLRQVRVQRSNCRIAGAVEYPCYPQYSPEIEERAAIVGKTSGKNYTWRDGFGELETTTQVRFLSVINYLQADDAVPDTFGRGGFSSYLCSNSSPSVSELEEDQWINLGTRVVSLDFTLVNPTTEMFTVGRHIFAISPSGHINHKLQTTTMRLVSTWLDGHQQKADRYVFALWIFLSLQLLLTCLRESKNIRKMGLSPYLSSDFWNVFEMIQMTLLAQLLFSVYSFYALSSQLIDGLGLLLKTSNGYVDMYPVMDSFLQLADLAAVNALLGLLKVFRFLRMNTTLNLLWASLGMALKDLAGFMVIFSLIFCAYAAMGCLAFGFYLAEFHDFRSSFSTCFQMLAGDFDYEKLLEANPRLAPIFFGSFVVLCLQILVNMFVAILSEFYEKSRDEAQNLKDVDVEYDVYKRISEFLLSLSPTVVLTEPLQLSPGEIVRLISTNLMDKEVKRQRAKKRFRGAVWRVLALLRFGVKFDRRLITDQHRETSYDPSDKELATHIPLSDNFDHRTIKEMLPAGITIKLKGDSLIGDDITLKVVRHSALSTECKVMDSVYPGIESLELVGGERLIIPSTLFCLHLLRTAFKVLLHFIGKAFSWRHPMDHQLVDEYLLYRLLQSAQHEGCESLRFDELHRRLDMIVRKDRSRATISAGEVNKETALVMYRFRRCLIDMPSREKEGHNYRPKPLDTSSVDLGSLEFLADLLSENCHELWSLERIKQGWRYGPERDDKKKLHPNLIPFHVLPEEEKEYDRRTSVESIKTILMLQFQIQRVSTATLKTKGLPTFDTVRKLTSSSEGDDANTEIDSINGTKYRPRPIETDQIDLPKRLVALADLIAENAHEVWSKGRMEEGWTYGPDRDDKAKKHPCLVPYVFLTEHEKEYDLNTAMGTLKMLLAMGFQITDKTGG